MAKSPTFYVDFGYVSSTEFWREIVLPAYERFKSTPNRQNAMPAAILTWHFIDWIWHDKHPGEDTKGNPDFETFLKDVIRDCPELRWVRDVANASKHRGLTKKAYVQRVGKKGIGRGLFNTYTYGTMALNSVEFDDTLILIGNDGTKHTKHHVEYEFSKVMDYLQGKFVTPSP